MSLYHNSFYKSLFSNPNWLDMIFQWSNGELSMKLKINWKYTDFFKCARFIIYIGSENTKRLKVFLSSSSVVLYRNTNYIVAFIFHKNILVKFRELNKLLLWHDKTAEVCIYFLPQTFLRINIFENNYKQTLVKIHLQTFNVESTAFILIQKHK